MVQRKYTLPRHTNLAKISSRTGAFLIDLAIFGALFIGFHFGVMQFIFNPIADPYEVQIRDEQANSHLRSRDENGEVQPFDMDSSFEQFRDSISYYYMNYLTGNVTEPGTGSKLADEKIQNEKGELVSKAEYYTVEWFNKNILEIVSEDPDNSESSLFTYVKVDGVYDKTQLGIPKDASEASDTSVRAFMQTAYNNAHKDFNNLPYMLEVTNKAGFIHSCDYVLAALLASVVTYIGFPLIFKQGRTVGKKLFKLALASKDGYIFYNRQLPMRLLPLAVTLCAFLIPIWNNLVIVILVPLIIFLVSFALAMASPKHASLHDFTGRTIVVDDKTSIIFENEMEEEAYLLKEDNLVPEVAPESTGEEPELKYEK